MARVGQLAFFNRDTAGEPPSLLTRGDTVEKTGARSGSVGEGDWGFALGMSLTTGPGADELFDIEVG